VKHFAVCLLIPLALVPLSTRAVTQTAAEAIASAPAETRMRITAPQVSRGRIVGRVSHIAADTVYMAPNRSSLVAIPVSSITAAEMSRGKRRWLGAMKGAGIAGLTGGALMGTLVWTGDPNCDYCLPGREPGAAVAGAIIGAVLAAPTGAIVGAIVGSERWEPIGKKLTLMVTPSPSGSPGLQLMLSTR
jgi:hypothetical protein